MTAPVGLPVRLFVPAPEVQEARPAKVETEVDVDTFSGVKATAAVSFSAKRPVVERHDVIIIGAGVAGITAAKELGEKGLDVVVLEAQKRVGGRALSDNTRFSAPIDLGASWLHGVEANKLVPVFDKAGAHRVQTDLSGHLYVDGRPATTEELAEYKGELERFEAAMAGAVAQGKDVSAASLLDKNAKFSQVVSSQVGPFESAGETKDTSIVDAASFDSTQDDFVKEGIGNTVEKLAEGLPIKTDTPVQKIKYGASGVEVTTADGSVYRGKKVIVTVSTGVLASGKIKFDPPLPEWKQKAIEAIPMGVLDKVILEFDHNIFGDSKENVWVALHEANTDVPMSFVLRPLGANIAVGFVGGDVAKRMQQRPAKELIAEAMNKLGDMFGTAMVHKSLQSSAVTRWGQNPWTMGSYSYATPGNGAERARLKEPVGTSLFFAGEAMSRPEVNASLAGAYESGIDAASAVTRQIVHDAVTAKKPELASGSPLNVRALQGHY